MVKWPWYGIAFIIIVATIILSLSMGRAASSLRNRNLKSEEENTLKFFTMNLPSSEADPSNLTLSCPGVDGDGSSGSKPLQIEILGAYFDVFDPWGQCSPEPSDLIADTCEADAANNQGMCSNLVETLDAENSLSSQWYRNKVCGSRYQRDHGYGGDANNKKGNHTEPYGGSDYVCRLQDATPFLAARCNGEKECTINLDNSDEVSQVFGSLPCYNAMTEVPLKVGDPDYGNLPSDKKSHPPFQQGYVVRGAYRCAPSSE